MFPGPTLEVNNGDTLVVNIVNILKKNHRRQLLQSGSLKLLHGQVRAGDPSKTPTIHTLVKCSCWGRARPQTSSSPPISPPARYYMAARAYNSAQGAPFDNTITTAILQYKSNNSLLSTPPVSTSSLPAYNDTNTATAFSTAFQSRTNVQLSTDIGDNLFFTVGLELFNCPPGASTASNCQAPNGSRFTASMNNVSFGLPFNFSLLQEPVTLATCSKHQVVQVEGFVNFNPKTDTSSFNLVDPPLRNTVGLPVKGWAVIRFVADNPGNESQLAHFCQLEGYKLRDAEQNTHLEVTDKKHKDSGHYSRTRTSNAGQPTT
ncbi:hypothetical protein NE237_014627 [Protea cynaroides]|uniref:Plastocyanin-like domain-containing protein n=1 Tax=Protea cynaroides TaxID=273540 RepID=A0A9Q0KCN8_9MAGN|nr:hypothetical protein NE237_014627 [Protea cynaroides]